MGLLTLIVWSVGVGLPELGVAAAAVDGIVVDSGSFEAAFQGKVLLLNMYVCISGTWSKRSCLLVRLLYHFCHSLPLGQY